MMSQIVVSSLDLPDSPPELPIEMLRQKAQHDTADNFTGDDSVNSIMEAIKASRSFPVDGATPGDRPDSDSESDDSNLSLINAIEKARKTVTAPSKSDKSGHPQDNLSLESLSDVEDATDSGQDNQSLDSLSDVEDDSNNTPKHPLDIIKELQEKSEHKSGESDESDDPPDWIQKIQGDTQQQMLKQLLGPNASSRQVKQHVSPTMVSASHLRELSKSNN